MSKEPAKTPESTEGNAGSKKKLLIMIVAAAIFASVLGGGVAFVLLKKSHPPTEGEETKTEHPKKKADTPPIIAKLDPFTVKLQSDEGKQEQYMQTTVELDVLDPTVVDKIKAYTPKIRSKTILLFMSRKPSDLSTTEGIESLTNDMRNMLNEIIDGRKPSDPSKATSDDSIQDVYLTNFIIQ